MGLYIMYIYIYNYITYVMRIFIIWMKYHDVNRHDGECRG